MKVMYPLILRVLTALILGCPVNSTTVPVMARLVWFLLLHLYVYEIFLLRMNFVLHLGLARTCLIAQGSLERDSTP